MIGDSQGCPDWGSLHSIAGAESLNLRPPGWGPGKLNRRGSFSFSRLSPAERRRSFRVVVLEPRRERHAVGGVEAEFRRLAEECLKLARKAKSPEKRLLLLDMAQAWLTLASNTEKLQHGYSGENGGEPS